MTESKDQQVRNHDEKWSNEQVLIDGLRNGNEEAFGYLLDTYYGQLLRVAMSHVPSRAVAEEVVQETWQGVLESLPRFEGRSSLKTWLFRILTNRAKTRGKRESRYESMDSEEGESEGWTDPDRFIPGGGLQGHWDVLPTPWDDRTPERLLLSKESQRLILAAIDALPPVQRQVMMLRDIEDIEANEICNLLDITETNQRVLLHRARTKVRHTIEAQLSETDKKE
ncbi:MAG: sigma-70 family RNA polymerase sigma factor [Nitrospirota bacterium]|nr:sigma-70 family RNA polymerase sigma factor [Nitrospirota bacterium]